MTELFTEADSLRRKFAGGAAFVLLAGAVALAVTPRSVEKLTGIRPAPALASPDDLPAPSNVDATPFFRERDEIEVRVAATTTLRQFLDRNRLNRPYTRRQIIEQLGNANPDAEIAAGTVFHLRLTPVAEDVPGAAPDATK